MNDLKKNECIDYLQLEELKSFFNEESHMPVCAQSTVNERMECGVHCAIGHMDDQLEMDYLAGEEHVYDSEYERAEQRKGCVKKLLKAPKY